MTKKIDGVKKAAHDYYCEALKILTDHKAPFLLGGGFALRQYTGIVRDTKDLDIFCKSADCPKILKILSDEGYKTEITDPRWLAKAFKKNDFIDIVFSNSSNLCSVDDSWFEHAVKCEQFGIKMKMIAPEELMWSKIYIQSRERYDAADINHIILKYGKKLNWKRIWGRLETHWQLLMGQIMSFMFVYPSERDNIPKWLFDALLDRAKDVYDSPLPIQKVCRGPLLDHAQYGTDITDWDYRTVTINSI